MAEFPQKPSWLYSPVLPYLLRNMSTGLLHIPVQAAYYTAFRGTQVALVHVFSPVLSIMKMPVSMCTNSSACESQSPFSDSQKSEPKELRKKKVRHSG